MTPAQLATPKLASPTMSERHAVTAIGLTKQFEGMQRPAAEDINFFANAGEVLAILGPNGAGKTTTLRMLATLLAPTMGTATILGFDARREPLEIRRRLGFVSPDTHLHPDLSIEETLDFFGRIYGLAGHGLAEQRERVLRHFELLDYRRRRVGTLSTGMRQRCNLARTLLHDPELLILDEPSSGLDILASGTVMAFIEEARDRGKTVLLSTHSIREAEQLGDRIAVIAHGSIRGFGTAQELREETNEAQLEACYLELIRRGFEL